MKTERLALRFAVLSGANLFVSALGFLATIAIARAYGPQGLGLTNLATSIISFALASTIFGTDLYAFRKVSRQPEHIGRHLAAITRLRSVTMGLSYGLMIAVVALVPRLHDALPLAAVLGLSLLASPLAQEWLPQVLRRTDVTALANAAAQSIYLALLAGVVLLGGPLWMAMLAKGAADVIVALGLRWWTRRVVAICSWHVPVSELLDIARNGLPIFATQVLRTLALASDIVLLGFFVSRADLGYYSSASRIFYLLMAFTTAYFVVLLPRFSEAGVGTDADLKGVLRESLASTLPVGLLMVGLVAVAGRGALALGFGADYAVASPSLTLLALATLASLVGRHYRQVLLSRGRHVADLRLNVTGAVTHIVAKLFLIPLMGFTGAAIGTLAGETATALAQRRAARRELAGVQPARSDGGRTIAGSSTMPPDQEEP